MNLTIQHVFSFFVQRELNGHFFFHFNCQIIYDIYVHIFEIQYQRSFQISGCLRPVGGVCCTGESSTFSLSVNPWSLPKYKNRTKIWNWYKSYKDSQLNTAEQNYYSPDSEYVFRCFPPSSPQQLDTNTDGLGAFDDLGTLDDPEAFPKTDSLNVERSDIRLSDCGPQGSPVAEAGPGVSYPGYKQYCRCLS